MTAPPPGYLCAFRLKLDLKPNQSFIVRFRCLVIEIRIRIIGILIVDIIIVVVLLLLLELLLHVSLLLLLLGLMRVELVVRIVPLLLVLLLLVLLLLLLLWATATAASIRIAIIRRTTAHNCLPNTTDPIIFGLFGVSIQKVCQFWRRYFKRIALFTLQIGRFNSRALCQIDHPVWAGVLVLAEKQFAPLQNEVPSTPILQSKGSREIKLEKVQQYIVSVSKIKG